MAFHKKGGTHSTCWRPEWKGRQRKEEFPVPAWWRDLSYSWMGTHTISLPHSQAFMLRLEPASQVSWVSSFCLHIMGLLSFHHHVRHFLTVNQSLSLSTLGPQHHLRETHLPVFPEGWMQSTRKTEAWEEHGLDLRLVGGRRPPRQRSGQQYHASQSSMSGKCLCTCKSPKTLFGESQESSKGRRLLKEHCMGGD